MRYKDFKTEYLIIFCTILIKAILHLAADSNSGLDGDEVLYIEAGKHLSAGFMEAPPMIGVLAFIQNLFHSESVYVNHIFVHLLSGAIIFLCGLMTIKLGGRWKAVLLTMLCISLAPALCLTNNSFQPVILDQFFWVLCSFWLICYIQNPKDKYLIFLGVSAALGFLSKYSIVFFILGLFLSVIVLKPALLRNRILWFSVLIFLVIISPNLYWQIKHSFPVFNHFSALYKITANETFTWNALQFLLTLNPFSAPVWFTGIFLIFFSKEFVDWRLLSLSMFFSFIILILAKGRFYYFFPIVLTGFCTGSVFIENLFRNRKWVLTSYLMIITLTGSILLPLGLPVIPLKQYIKILDLKPGKDGRIPIRAEARYTADDWKRLTAAVYNAYNQLPPDEKNNCLILGADYTQPSVINLFGPKYGLPQAFSFHGSYFLWIPEFPKNTTIIAIGNSHLPEDYPKWTGIYEQLFDKVEISSHVFCPFARDDRNACFHIFICHGLKVDSDGFKQLFRERIFE
jgi:hypothetical protein